ncbi:MAG TPA: hypothetical protein VGG16_11950 [Streptosporangiaceae bacterium]|jgi:hypothetical protein
MRILDHLAVADSTGVFWDWGGAPMYVGTASVNGSGLRPNPVQTTRAIYQAKRSRWRERWPEPTVLPWPEP